MTSRQGESPDTATLEHLILADDALPAQAARFRVSLEQVLMNAGFVVLVVSICWGVLSRYVLETPATWVEEVSSIAFAWTTFLGAAEVQRRRKHVSVDVFTGMLPGRYRSALSFAMTIFVALFCFYVAWLGWREALASGSAKTPMLGIPLSVTYIGLAFGFLLMGLRTLQPLAARLWSGGRSH
jgi:TRAP-type C4-dicarboxylate transport system permease small subunit